MTARAPRSALAGARSAVSAETPSGAPAGRPRDPTATTAILDAAAALLAAGGYGAMTTDAVAARARASKATVYRRWPDKPALAAAAVRHALTQAHAAPLPRVARAGRATRARGEEPKGDACDTARAAVTASLARVAEGLRATALGGAIRGLISEAAREPALGRALAALDADTRANGPLRAAVLRAQAAGCAADADPDLLLDLLLGPLYFHLLVRQTTPTAALAARVVAYLFASQGAAQGAPLPRGRRGRESAGSTPGP